MSDDRINYLRRLNDRLLYDRDRQAGMWREACDEIRKLRAELAKYRTAVCPQCGTPYRNGLNHES